MPIQTKKVKPLRKVTSIAETGRMGEEISPHAFWMTAEYELILECGHSQIRTSCNFQLLEVEELFPSRVRCADCNTVESRSVPKKNKETPQFDPLALRLAQELINSSPDSEDIVLAWLASPMSSWIGDDTKREQVWAATGLHMAHRLSARVTTGTEMVDELLRSLEAFIHSPSEDTRKSVAKSRDRIYRHQHSIDPWLSARGLVCVASSTSRAPHVVAQKIVDAVSWCDESREALYDKVLSSRESLDRARYMDSMMLFARGDTHGDETSSEVRNRYEKLQQDVATATDLSLSSQHAPILRDLIAAFIDARNEFESKQ